MHEPVRKKRWRSQWEKWALKFQTLFFACVSEISVPDWVLSFQPHTNNYCCIAILVSCSCLSSVFSYELWATSKHSNEVVVILRIYVCPYKYSIPMPLKPFSTHSPSTVYNPISLPKKDTGFWASEKGFFVTSLVTNASRGKTKLFVAYSVSGGGFPHLMITRPHVFSWRSREEQGLGATWNKEWTLCQLHKNPESTPQASVCLGYSQPCWIDLVLMLLDKWMSTGF